MTTISRESETSKIEPDVCWESLQKVVNSRELKRAARLRVLLLYLGERSLQGGPAQGIREQEVGAAVFDRPENYDTNLDNIVRVNVSELRKRLAHYYEGEGASDRLMIEVPRGGYLIVFTLRPVPSAIPPPVPEPAAEQVAKVEEAFEPPAPALVEVAASIRPNRLTALLLTALLLSIAVAGFLLWQNHTLRTQLRPWQADARLNAFWSQFFASGEEVDIVTADASFALEEDMLRRPISLNDYLDFKYKALSSLPGVSPEMREALDLVLDRNNGSVGDFQVAERLMVLGGHVRALKLATARSYTPESIKQNNVILIGSRESNPWVELYKDRMNFYLDYEPERHRSFVVNHAPLPGEQSIYELAQDRNHGYSVATFLPNLSDGRYALLIAGTDSQATRAAGEFVTSGEGLAAIRQKLPAGKFPFFEVVLASSKLVGTPLRTEIVAYRGH